MSASGTATPWSDVRLLGLPVDLYTLAQEHDADLVRELTLIEQGRHGSPAPQVVPGGLVEVMRELLGRYGKQVALLDLARDQGYADGTEVVDVLVRMPAAAGPSAAEAWLAFDAADAFCRAGEHLLTLASPAPVVAFRRWLLGQIIVQTQAGPPTPWRPELVAELGHGACQPPAVSAGG